MAKKQNNQNLTAKIGEILTGSTADDKVNGEDYSGLSEHELLSEILRSQRKSEHQQKVGAVAGVVSCVALVIALLILIPAVLRVVGNANQLMVNTNQAVAQSIITMQNADNAISEISTLTETAQNTLSDLSEVTGGMTEVDYDRLNQSIADLSTIVAPLARLLQAFN